MNYNEALFSSNPVWRHTREVIQLKKTSRKSKYQRAWVDLSQRAGRQTLGWGGRVYTLLWISATGQAVLLGWALRRFPHNSTGILLLCGTRASDVSDSPHVLNRSPRSGENRQWAERPVKGERRRGIHLFYHTARERPVSWVTAGAIVMWTEHKMGKGP